MELEFIYENKLGKAEYDREKCVVHGSFSGLFNTELGQEWFEAILDFVANNKVKGITFDCLNMKGTFTKLNPFINEVFYPKMIAQGYCCWSLATSDIFTKFAANMLINKMTPKEITVKLFGDIEKTKEWVYDFIEKKELEIH